MILYHGTNTHFDEFSNDYLCTEESLDQYGSGFYFYSDKGKTVLHGGLRITADVHIQNPTEHTERWNPSWDEIESLILESPDLDYKLTNYGDVDYYGFDHVLESTIRIYVQEDFITRSLNTIGNDFFDPKDTHLLLSKFVKLTGINCITDLSRDIYVVLDKKQIDILSVIHEQDDY